MMNASKKKRRRSCVLNLYNNNNEQLYPLGYIEEEKRKGCCVYNYERFARHWTDSFLSIQSFMLMSFSSSSSSQTFFFSCV